MREYFYLNQSSIENRKRSQSTSKSKQLMKTQMKGESTSSNKWLDYCYKSFLVKQSNMDSFSSFLRYFHYFVTSLPLVLYTLFYLSLVPNKRQRSWWKHENEKSINNGYTARKAKSFSSTSSKGKNE
jgi:hypothetical protein